jgi:hypothetical protein
MDSGFKHDESARAVPSSGNAKIDTDSVDHKRELYAACLAAVFKWNEALDDIIFIEVFSVASLVLELGEHECGLGDVADPTGAQGDTTQRFPSCEQHRRGAFARRRGPRGGAAARRRQRFFSPNRIVRSSRTGHGAHVVGSDHQAIR